MALIYAGNKLNKDSLIEKGFSKDFNEKGFIKYIIYRDVSTGATGATAVAPKFSDTLTLFQPGGQILPLHCRGRTKKFPEVTSLTSIRT